MNHNEFRIHRTIGTGLVIVLFLAVTVLLLWPTQTDAQTNAKPAAKLSPRLRVLTQSAAALGFANDEAQIEALNLAVEGQGSLLTNEQGELLVYVQITDTTSPTLQLLTDAGAEVVHVSDEYSTVTAYIPLHQLATVAQLTAVESIHEELQPDVPTSLPLIRTGFEITAFTEPPDCRPLALSEGMVQLKVDEVHSTFGLDGSGVTIGVLSDSFNNYDPTITPPAPPTIAGMNIQSGDLPGSDNPCGWANPVTIVKEGRLGTDEGRAMLQIVHDLAPGADLAFATAANGIFDFADQIRNLRAAGADIIVDDYGYFAEPYFQDGPVSQAIAEVTAAGAIYFTAVGNNHLEVNGSAIGSYEAPAYRPVPCPAQFGPDGDCHDFDPGVGIDNTSGFILQPDSALSLNLQWAEPWDGVQTDLDVYLLDSTGAVIASSNDDNLLFQRPHEYFYYENLSGGIQTVQLVIYRYAGAAPRLKYILLQDTYGILDAEYTHGASGDIMGPTVFGHSGADEAISVGAIEYNELDVPQWFTSWGNPVYYFGPVMGPTAADPLPIPEIRQKPDITATNGGCTTFFGEFNASSPCYRFYGTSAAAPHAAAVGALVLQRARQFGLELDQKQVETILETTARPILNGSPEAVGAGLIDALAAVNAVKPFPNLVLAQSATPGIVRPGDVISYTLTLGNNGSAPAQDVAVVSSISQGAMVVEGSADGFVMLDGSRLRWEVGELPEGSVLTRTFQIMVGDAVPHGTVIESVAQATAAENISDTVATVTGVYVEGIQASLTANAELGSEDTGTVISYTLAVANYTDEALANLTVSNTLPNGLQYIEGSSTVAVSSINYDFEPGRQGWSVGSNDGNPLMNWELGPPTPLQPTTASKCLNLCFGRGAHQDHTPGLGTSAWGTDLDDLYSNETEQGFDLYSPVFDFSDHTQVQLTYWEWLEVENGGYDEARLEYRVGTAPWTTAWSSVQPEARIDDVWSQMTHTAAYADGQSEVQWRWRLTTDSEFQFGGWYIDDVHITFAEANLARPANPLPALLTADEQYTLAPNQTITVTWAVAVVDPLSADGDDIVNTVQVSADGRLIATLSAKPVASAGEAQAP